MTRDMIWRGIPFWRDPDGYEYFSQTGFSVSLETDGWFAVFKTTHNKNHPYGYVSIDVRGHGTSPEMALDDALQCARMCINEASEGLIV